MNGQRRHTSPDDAPRGGTTAGDVALGDALALARQRWIHEAQRRVLAAGYQGFKRSDTVVLRRLRRGSAALVDLAEVMGVTRQAARKVVTDLQERGYVVATRDERDARRTLVTLTDSGEKYARTLAHVASDMNREASLVLESQDVEVALRVLRAMIARWET